MTINQCAPGFGLKRPGDGVVASFFKGDFGLLTRTIGVTIYCYVINFIVTTDKVGHRSNNVSTVGMVARSNRHPRYFYLLLVTVLQVEREVDVLFYDHRQTFRFYF
jgi:hypothetical protein